MYVLISNKWIEFFITDFLQVDSFLRQNREKGRGGVSFISVDGHVAVGSEST